MHDDGLKQHADQTGDPWAEADTRDNAGAEQHMVKAERQKAASRRGRFPLAAPSRRKAERCEHDTHLRLQCVLIATAYVVYVISNLPWHRRVMRNVKAYSVRHLHVPQENLCKELSQWWLHAE